jgi:hypothetical protein
MWALVGGLSGALRIAIGACVAVAAMYLVVVPIERADARKGLVSEYRATSAEAERDELQRQLNAGKIVIDAYDVQLRNAYAKQEATADELEKRILENEAIRTAGNRRCDLDDSDRKFLLHGK